VAERKWRIRLGAVAELDFANILKWTTENFGEQQSRLDRNTIIQAIAELNWAKIPTLRDPRPETSHSGTAHAARGATEPPRKSLVDVSRHPKQYD
jgi:hypothetical protein